MAALPCSPSCSTGGTRRAPLLGSEPLASERVQASYGCCACLCPRLALGATVRCPGPGTRPRAMLRLRLPESSVSVCLHPAACLPRFPPPLSPSPAPEAPRQLTSRSGRLQRGRSTQAASSAAAPLQQQKGQKPDALPFLVSDPYVTSLLSLLPPLPQTPPADAPLDGPTQLQNEDPSPAALLARLRSNAVKRALSLPWPTRKDEAFRFTDLRPLQELPPQFPLPPPRQLASLPGLDLSDFSLGVPRTCQVVTLDGAWQERLSSPPSSLPPGLTLCPLSQLPQELLTRLWESDSTLGRVAADLDLFSELNSAAAQDVIVIFATESPSPPPPVHIIHATSAAPGPGAMRVSAPRLLVVAAEGAEVEVVEEFLGLPSGDGGGCYWTNAVAEVVLGKGAKVLHGVVQQQAREAFHTKTTAVQQEEESEYSLIEAQLGGRLARHSVRVKQLGADTRTNISTFSLCGARQLQDLHSSLILDHPRGTTRQIHKCIVTDSSGQGVFDGNVQVNRFAQQTDAGQLTRSLLLAPRGTVNVKPNLQIVADDVKCTHGAAISDLDEDQLFYFQARGINESTARSALVFSFAAEVVEKFPYTRLKSRVEGLLKESLAQQGAMDPSVAALLQGSEV